MDKFHSITTEESKTKINIENGHILRSLEAIRKLIQLEIITARAYSSSH